MTNFIFLRLRVVMAMVVTVLLAAACGGGGGGLSLDNVGGGGTGAISGVAIKGPVGHATMTAYGISGGQIGTKIDTATTDVNGKFTIQIGGYAGPVLLQMSGGSYIDEATGKSMDMAAGDVLTAILPSVAANSNTAGVQVTPLTAMAQARAQHMPGGMTEANIAAANAAMGKNFSVSDILHVEPMNPLIADSGLGVGVSQDSKNYGMTLAAMSKYAQTLGLSFSSSMVTAMMTDASDGIMNGRNDAGPISMSMGGMMGTSTLAPSAGTSSLSSAMTVFMSSTANASGLSAPDMAALIQKLANSDGQI